MLSGDNLVFFLPISQNIFSNIFQEILPYPPLKGGGKTLPCPPLKGGASDSGGAGASGGYFIIEKRRFLIKKQPFYDLKTAVF